jgi:hypothetical protein
MAITRARTSSVAQGPSTRKTVLGGNDVILPGSYDALGTAVVGAGGQTTITFSSIPSTYKHLQIRGLTKATGASNVGFIRFNSDANGVYHQLIGDGATVTADRGTGNSDVGYFFVPGNSFGTNVFGGLVMDILDYANTNKNKVTRDLSGVDANGSGSIVFTSGLWINTAAVTSISIRTSGNFAQYSSFDLYGIK